MVRTKNRVCCWFWTRVLSILFSMILLALPLLGASIFVGAPALLTPVYQASVVRVVDGDTVNVRVRIWLNQELSASIRVRNVDSPEINGKCVSESALAQKAKAFTAHLLPVGSTITLTNVKPDKFGGRFDADVFTPDGQALSDLLIASGMTRIYDGGKREGWCGGASR